MAEHRSPRHLRIVVRPGGALSAALTAGSFDGLPESAPCEFHIAADARRTYGVSDALFRSGGNAVFADFRAVREFAAKMNARRGPGSAPVRAGELNAMGLIDEILHFVFRLYETSVNPGVLGRGLAAVAGTVGGDSFSVVQDAFTSRFPPVEVYRERTTPPEWLQGSSDGRAHREVSLEELLMLHLANANPAFGRFRELFDDGPLAARSAYAAALDAFRSFLRSEAPFGEPGGSIVDFLEGPMRAHPDDLAAQLGYIRDRWGVILTDEFRRKILSAGDLTREDAKRYPTGGAGTPEAPDYRRLAASRPSEYPETVNFTHDTEWMPNVVLIAKNAYVWLAQLSREHGREIARLDQVPDAELDKLARWNFTALWLIGVWHRSPASENIKRMTGNPEAAASAYSLHDYEIAPELGGEPAFAALAERAWARGIRLAADMVPNHTGITSHWMREHPDYFIQADHPPFPAYRFTGPDLSDDPAYSVRIEDGYWTRSDAAVVFQYVDNASGRLRYIYHGNDGTNMPWNDTAQLDFLRADVREAVIGQILRVARRFPVIRFDAAMTLTKRHFHRLWYPHPGTGGDIPSRADRGMSQEDFDRLFPAEFWREVVDRINRETPETLLLAEAFWLLEGYFVRTLGMHRVYNSAFMHMMMKEDNAIYRGAIRSTLQFEPGILKRYVNFMSNPDERTAIDQFGDGDKYFGVATLMATIPGLPMFAHGQVEGYRERYGMEYRRDYHNERPNPGLIARHEREIFPLLGLRRLFSQTDHFELYDLRDEHGNTVEDVFAHSNMADGMRAVVCYNNRYAEYAGTVMHSAGKLSDGAVRHTTLGEALALGRGGDRFWVFREQRSALEFVRTADELQDQGLFVRLRAFETQVFLDFRDFRETAESDGSWRTLHRELAGGGTGDAVRAARTIALRPLHAALAPLLQTSATQLEGEELQRLAVAAASIAVHLRPPLDGGGPALGRELASTISFIAAHHRSAGSTRADAAAMALRAAVIGTFFAPGGLYGKVAKASALADGSPTEVFRMQAAATAIASLAGVLYDSWLLDDAVEASFADAIADPEERRRAASRVRALVVTAASARSPQFYESPAVRAALAVNEHQGTVFFNKEAFEALTPAALLVEAFRAAKAGTGTDDQARLLAEAAGRSGYRLDEFVRALSTDFRTLTADPNRVTDQGT